MRLSCGRLQLWDEKFFPGRPISYKTPKILFFVRTLKWYTQPDPLPADLVGSGRHCHGSGRVKFSTGTVIPGTTREI